MGNFTWAYWHTVLTTADDNTEFRSTNVEFGPETPCSVRSKNECSFPFLREPDICCILKLYGFNVCTLFSMNNGCHFSLALREPPQIHLIAPCTPVECTFWPIALSIILDSGSHQGLTHSLLGMKRLSRTKLTVFQRVKMFVCYDSFFGTVAKSIICSLDVGVKDIYCSFLRNSRHQNEMRSVLCTGSTVSGIN